jgi:hypothetical protein
MPTYPCVRCGREVAVRFKGFRVEPLKHVGWRLFNAETYMNWVRARAGGDPDAAARRTGDVRAGAGGGQLMAWRPPPGIDPSRL